MIETQTRLVKHNDGGASVVLDVTVDGVGCGSLVICSGQFFDVCDFYEGRISLKELRERWS